MPVSASAATNSAFSLAIEHLIEIGPSASWGLFYMGGALGSDAAKGHFGFDVKAAARDGIDLCPTVHSRATTPRMIQRLTANASFGLAPQNPSATFFAVDRVTPGPCRGACAGEVQQ